MMCDGCPFRRPGESRDALVRYIVDAPEETWPCHESCIGECDGRNLFAVAIARTAPPKPTAREGGGL
jgi:hypothetical protein